MDAKDNPVRQTLLNQARNEKILEIVSEIDWNHIIWCCESPDRNAESLNYECLLKLRKLCSD